MYNKPPYSMLSTQENYKIMRIAMRHRAAMVPYIYTEARAAYDTGIYAIKLSNRTFATCL